MAHIKFSTTSLLLSIFILLISTSIAFAEQIEMYRHSFANSQGFGVAVDQQGNTLLTGAFRGTTDFDPGSNVFNVTSLTNNDIFVAKYDAEGNFVWVQTINEGSQDKGYEVAVDNAGNVYAAGLLNNKTFLAKYTSDGVVMWQHIINTLPHEYFGFDLFVDENGNLYLTDYFSNSSVDFDPGTGVFNLTATGDEMYFAKFDTDGTFMWAKHVGGSGSVYANALTVSTAGTIYLAGAFIMELDFDPGTNVYNLNEPNGSMFVAVYDNGGNFIQAWKSSSGTYAEATGIGVDNTGNIYVSGRFHGDVDFDPSAATLILNGGQSLDLFLLRFDAAGNLIWGRHVEGTNSIDNHDMAIDSVGNLYVIGVFTGTADFDPGSDIFNLTHTGLSASTYTASYTNSGDFRWAQRVASSTVINDSHGISLYNNTNVFLTGFTSNIDGFQAYLINLFQVNENIATVTENEFYAAFETQRINYPEIAQGLADFVPGQINLTIRLNDGTVGVVNIAFESSEGLVTMRITGMSVNESSNVPTYFRDTINRNLLQLIAETLDALVMERFGEVANVETITITEATLEISLET